MNLSETRCPCTEGDHGGPIVAIGQVGSDASVKKFGICENHLHVYRDVEQKYSYMNYHIEMIRSTCGYSSTAIDPIIKHGPIVAEGTNLGTQTKFDICDLHLQHYRSSGFDFQIKLKYSGKDISSDRAVASRKQQAIGTTDVLRSKYIAEREKLL